MQNVECTTQTFLTFQFVASMPVLKAPWMTCKPQLQYLSKQTIRLLLSFWWHCRKIPNWQVDNPLIFDTFLINPTPPYTFQTLSLSKSAAVPWPKNFEFQYRDSTGFFWLIKKRYHNIHFTGLCDRIQAFIKTSHKTTWLFLYLHKVKIWRKGLTQNW